MKPPSVLKRAGIPIVVLALVLAPAAAWAQSSPANPLSDEPGRKAHGKNNTTADPAEFHFEPAASAMRALPGGQAHHGFRLVVNDAQLHQIEIRSSPSENGTAGNGSAWSHQVIRDSFEFRRVTWVDVVVKAPLAPPLGELSYTVEIFAFEGKKEVASATAKTSYVLP